MRKNFWAILIKVDEASTSGDYYRFFEEEGVRYHHILNPSPVIREETFECGQCF